jgi:trigger factor
MQAQVEELGDSKVRLTVEVPSADVRHAVEHAASDLAVSTRIPGFRRGKVPLAVLVKRIGKERIYAEAVDTHIGNWFWNAAARTRIRPVSQPEYGYSLPQSSDSSWEFTATVAVQPKLELPDWRALEVPFAEVEVPSELVEQALHDLQELAADLTPVDGRAAQRGDVLVLDLELAGDSRRDYAVELGGGRLAPELDEALVGVAVGGTASVEIPVSETETSSIEAKVNEIHEKVLPPLDDDVARKVTEFDTLDELRTDVEGTLGKQLDAEVESAFRTAAVDALVEATNVDPGGPLVETRTRDLLNGLARSVERRGISLETYLSLTGRTPEQLIDALQAEAHQSVSRELVLEALADAEGIAVADDKVDALIREQLEEPGSDDDKEFEETVARLRESGGYESLREDLRLREALDRLAAGVQRIAAELAEAREKLWTPEKEKPEISAKLWTPGSKEPA